MVGIPGGAPTGAVFNATGGFKVGGAPAHFIFDSEAGTITAWNAGTQAVTEATTPDAVYKGLAIASKGSATLLYAANFHTGKIDVFNDAFAPVTVPGGFVDPNLPAGFAPFNVQEIAGRLVVAFAQQDPNSADDVARPGPRLRRRLRHERPPAAAADLTGRPERALGPGGRPAALRAVQRRPAGRQLRRRGDQRLRPADAAPSRAR